MWNEKKELPEEGILKLKYVDFQPKQQTTIHYSLDLAETSEREIAISLWQRATIEPGENWINETMNGEPFDMDEANLGWDLPNEGRLELDYISYEMKFEAAYELSLSNEQAPGPT